MSKGKLIVIEGLDGSGKATQAKLLAQHLAGQGLPVREVKIIIRSCTTGQILVLPEK